MRPLSLFLTALFLTATIDLNASDIRGYKLGWTAEPGSGQSLVNQTISERATKQGPRASWMGVAAELPHLSTIAATTLVEERLLKMGPMGSTEVFVALENLTNEASLEYLTDTAPVGLVISVFVEERGQPGDTTQGELARAIWDRAEKASHPVGAKIQKWFDKLATRKPGDVVGFNLGLSKADRAKFPVDRLIAVMLEKGHSHKNSGRLEKALVDVFADAKRERLAAVVVPCIGYRWDEKHSLEFEEIFEPLFKALHGSPGSFKVFVSLYEMWPSIVIENAIQALNRAGQATAAATSQIPPHSR